MPLVTPDTEELDPAAVKMIAKVRRLMLVSGLFTLLGVAAVLVVIGYRVWRGEGSAPAATVGDVSITLPQGARIGETIIGDGRIVVRVEQGGRTVLHIFDSATLAPRGRIVLNSGP
jgi:hypothetical protein